VDDDRVTMPQSYRDVLAGNAAAQRARLRLRGESVAARMRALGWKTWRKQTVSDVEAGKRAIQGDEVLGLALVLQTTVPALTALPFDAAAVALPSGDLVAAARVTANIGGVDWEGDSPKLTPPAGVTPPLDAQLAARREELHRMEAYIEDLHRRAESHDDHGTGPEHPGAASGPASE
jgi:hypothetical protein